MPVNGTTKQAQARVWKLPFSALNFNRSSGENSSGINRSLSHAEILSGVPSDSKADSIRVWSGARGASRNRTKWSVELILPKIPGPGGAIFPGVPLLFFSVPLSTVFGGSFVATISLL